MKALKIEIQNYKEMDELDKKSFSYHDDSKSDSGSKSGSNPNSGANSEHED